MVRRKVLIIGNSLYAAGISRTLSESETVEVVNTVTTIDELVSWPCVNGLDALIVVGTDGDSAETFGPLVAKYPNLPILRADLSSDRVQVTTSRCIKASIIDLLATIATLPPRRRAS